MKKRKDGIKFKVSLYLGILTGIVLGGYCAKNHIINFYENACDRISDISGFKIQKIEILGATSKVAKMVRNKIELQKNDPILKISSSEIYARVASIPWVKTVVVKKNLPNVITIEIEEAHPIAIYQHNAKSILIDSDGHFLEEVSSRPARLPLVSGENANKVVCTILEEISKFEDIREKLEALSFIRERRWNLIISGVKVKLPENDINNALTILDTLIKNNKLNKNIVNSVDLRLPGHIILNGLKIRKTSGI